MGSKFLPFIGAGSTPINIYNTILSRSKGMSHASVASLLHIVLREDIVEVRNVADQIQKQTTTELYEAVIEHYNQHRISPEWTALFKAMAPYVDPDKDFVKEHSANHSVEDYLIFVAVMAQMEDFPSPASGMLTYANTDFLKIFKSYENILNNLDEYLALSDKAENVKEFSRIIDLKAYIFYVICFTYEPLEPMCFILLEGAE